VSAGVGTRDTPRRKEFVVPPKKVLVTRANFALSPRDSLVGPEPLVVFPDVDLAALRELLQSGETNGGINFAHARVAIYVDDSTVTDVNAVARAAHSVHVKVIASCHLAPSSRSACMNAPNTAAKRGSKGVFPSCCSRA
jgi:hypothetical protein